MAIMTIAEFRACEEVRTLSALLQLRIETVFQERDMLAEQLRNAELDLKIACERQLDELRGMDKELRGTANVDGRSGQR